MATNESVTGNAVPVEKDQAFTGSRPNREVPDPRKAESLVGLPDVLKASPRGLGLESVHHRARRVIGPVVGHDDLEVSVILTTQPLQHGLQRRRASIRRHHHRASEGHRDASVRSMRRVGGGSGSSRLRWAFANL